MLPVVSGKAQPEAKDLSANILLGSAISGSRSERQEREAGKRGEPIQGCIII